MAGPGDVGPTLTESVRIPPTRTRIPRLDPPHRRPYLSIFGEVAIEQNCAARVGWKPLPGRAIHLPNASIRTCSSSGWGRSWS